MLRVVTRRAWVAEALSICPQRGQAKVTRGQMETPRTGPAPEDSTMPTGIASLPKPTAPPAAGLQLSRGRVEREDALSDG